jgi:cytochrome b561
MANLVFYLIVQLNLIFGVAGLIWPDKLMPVFGLLMFPWPASQRAIRIHGIVAVVGYVLVVIKILATGHH